MLQIRQEKPYYIADPEVDSLVSIRFNSTNDYISSPRHNLKKNILQILSIRFTLIRECLNLNDKKKDATQLEFD